MCERKLLLRELYYMCSALEPKSRPVHFSAASITRERVLVYRLRDAYTVVWSVNLYSLPVHAALVCPSFSDRLEHIESHTATMLYISVSVGVCGRVCVCVGMFG